MPAACRPESTREDPLQYCPMQFIIFHNFFSNPTLIGTGW